MRLPGINFLKDKWVLGGLLVGAGLYYLTSKHSAPMIPPVHKGFASPPVGGDLHTYFPHYDSPGQYELGSGNMRFSGQAELQRRLTIT